MKFEPKDFWGIKKEQRDFFHQKTCDRCNKPLDGRTMSWFTEETICLDCSRKEDILKRRMKKAGMNPDDYEGIGYIPSIEVYCANCGEEVEPDEMGNCPHCGRYVLGRGD